MQEAFPEWCTQAPGSMVRACLWRCIADALFLGHKTAGTGSVCGKGILFQKGQMTDTTCVRLHI